MKRAAEFGAFLALAAGAHLAVAAYAPNRDGAQSAGHEGAAAVSLQAASAEMAQMVETWDRPPDVAMDAAAPEAPQMAARAPKMPQTLSEAAPFTEQRKAPGLSMPQPEHLPEPSAKIDPPPPPPKPEPDTARLAEVRPTARPQRPAPAPPKKPKQTAARLSASQKAQGQGGGADAGEAHEQRAATLSASQRQSLTAQWGAQVRRKIERGKRYPASARNAAGTVKVRITVGRDGSLRGVTLAGSSGHRALDEAALRAVRAVRRFPPAPPGLSQPSYTFTLPMRFSS